jgi:hypothetical protein
LSRWSKVFTIEHDPRLISLTSTGPHELTIHHPIPDRHPEYLRGIIEAGQMKLLCRDYAWQLARLESVEQGLFNRVPKFANGR